MARKINDMLRRLPVWAVWIAGLIPLALLIWDTLQGNLGVDPVAMLEHRLGRTAIYFLIGGLAVTPLLRLTGISLMKFRRALGLLCFTYAGLHVLAWISTDMGFLWAQMGRDILKRPYLLFGMLAFAMLVPLAITSNNLSIRRLGGLKWKRLHMLVYAAAPLAALHWIWVKKTLPLTPVAWMAVILALLLVRVVLKRSKSAGRKKVAENTQVKSAT